MKEPAERRVHVVQVMLTEAELAEFEAAAKGAGLSLASFMRAATIRAIRADEVRP